MGEVALFVPAHQEPYIVRQGAAELRFPAPPQVRPGGQGASRFHSLRHTPAQKRTRGPGNEIKTLPSTFDLKKNLLLCCSHGEEVEVLVPEELEVLALDPTGALQHARGVAGTVLAMASVLVLVLVVLVVVVVVVLAMASVSVLVSMRTVTGSIRAVKARSTCVQRGVDTRWIAPQSASTPTHGQHAARTHLCVRGG